MDDNGFQIPDRSELHRIALESGVKVEFIENLFEGIKKGIEKNNMDWLDRGPRKNKYSEIVKSQLENYAPIDAIKNGIAIYKELEEEKVESDDAAEPDDDCEYKGSDGKDYATNKKNKNNNKNKSRADWRESWYNSGLDIAFLKKFKKKLENIPALNKPDSAEKKMNPDGLFTGYRMPNDEEELLNIFLNSTDSKYEKLLSLIDGDDLVEYHFDKVYDPLNLIVFTDDSSSMCNHLEKLYGSVEFFVEQHLAKKINLIIVAFERTIEYIIDCNKLQANNPDTPLMNQIKHVFQEPSGRGTNLSNTIKEWMKIEKDYIDPTKEKEYIIVNDGDDSMHGNFPTRVHVISFANNPQIREKSVQSGGVYSVFN